MMNTMEKDRFDDGKISIDDVLVVVLHACSILVLMFERKKTKRR